MNRRDFTLLMSALTVLGFLMLNALGQRLLSGARLDVTERGLFTLSDGTRTVLSDLGEPIELTLVYSRSVGADYPAIRAHAERVREMLAGYAARSGGRVRVTEVDPAPFSQAEDLARASGITAVPTEGPDPLYFGVIGRNLADDEIVIPFLAPEQDSDLEYDLTRMVLSLDVPEPPRLGVLTTLPGMKGDGRARGYSVLQDLAEAYRIEEIPERFVTLPDVDVLLIAHPPLLNERQIYLIDQYLLAGGRAVILLDPASRAAVANTSILDETTAAARSDLPRLLSNLGIELSENVVGDRDLALPVRVEVAPGRSVVVNQPLFFALPREYMSGDSSATADLGRTVNFGAPGALMVSPVSGIDAKPLMQTTEVAARLPAKLAIEDATPAAVLAAYRDEGTPFTLALEVTGRTRSVFTSRVDPVLPDDPILAEIVRAEMADPPEFLAESDEPFRIIVVADTDLLDDGFYVDPGTGQPAADNGAFIVNAVESLSGAVDLNALRARAPALRPMERVEAMREEAQARFFEEQSELEDQLREAETRMEELREAGAGSAFLDSMGAADPSPEAAAELARLRSDILAKRERLRAIEADFRRDIDRLEGQLKFVNIWLMPGLVVLAGIGLWFWRRRRVQA